MGGKEGEKNSMKNGYLQELNEKGEFRNFRRRSSMENGNTIETAH